MDRGDRPVLTRTVGDRVETSHLELTGANGRGPSAINSVQ
ncbi:MAG: hypothetical protein J07HX64_02268 [halophilic archaeon J07HX64]|nr:MAG: hypothetical protein J07HX64_02268 [halophilic archaeon J07HX64]